MRYDQVSFKLVISSALKLLDYWLYINPIMINVNQILITKLYLWIQDRTSRKFRRPLKNGILIAMSKLICLCLSSATLISSFFENFNIAFDKSSG